jgi:uncharacterized protein (DUF427 family)
MEAEEAGSAGDGDEHAATLASDPTSELGGTFPNVSLTVGTGPFGHRPSGRFDFEPPDRITFVEVHPRRVRGVKAGDVVVDSERVRLVYRTGSLPRYAFPESDVHVGSEPEPAIPGYVTVAWDTVDQWLEEDDEVVVHPRDPYHRIDVLRTSREILVRVAGDEAARSVDARILFETGLPPRYYLPAADVRGALTRRDGLVTGCAYKGFARYFDAPGAEAIAWTYPEPRRDGELVRGRICFFQERPEVELVVDGQVQEVVTTQWSGTDWIERATQRP